MSFISNVSFIGGGNMAGAIIDAILCSKVIVPQQISLFDPSSEKCAAFKAKGINIEKSNIELSKKNDILILAVKPQMMEFVLKEISPHLNCKCIVSIAAGVSVEYIKEAIGYCCPVVRVLPNTPMLTLAGMTVLAEAPDVPSDIFTFIKSIFESAGEVTVLPESKINEAIPLSSSSPAFFFRMLNAMAKCGVRHGISYNDAFKLAAVSMIGSAKYALNSEKTPEELIAQVSSPGGTTVAALSAFDDFDFENFLSDAFNRCIKRAYELGDSSK